MVTVNSNFHILSVIPTNENVFRNRPWKQIRLPKAIYCCCCHHPNFGSSCNDISSKLYHPLTFSWTTLVLWWGDIYNMDNCISFKQPFPGLCPGKETRLFRYKSRYNGIILWLATSVLFILWNKYDVDQRQIKF